MAWHNASGIDIFGADSTTVEHVIELRLYNYGEQPEYVTFTGVEAVSGELLADDRPVAPRLVDSPPPAPREVPPRGQLAVKFKVPAEAIAQGFVGFAELATGHRLFSAPEKVNTGLSALQSEITQVISEGQNERQRRH
jgi:hypothetical protein